MYGVNYIDPVSLAPQATPPAPTKGADDPNAFESFSVLQIQKANQRISNLHQQGKDGAWPTPCFESSALYFVWCEIYQQPAPAGQGRRVAHTLTWAMTHTLTWAMTHTLTWAMTHTFTWAMTHTLTWAVCPIFCMVLNILTRYPLRPFQASRICFLFWAPLQTHGNQIDYICTWLVFSGEQGYLNVNLSPASQLPTP